MIRAEAARQVKFSTAFAPWTNLPALCSSWEHQREHKPPSRKARKAQIPRSFASLYKLRI